MDFIQNQGMNGYVNPNIQPVIPVQGYGGFVPNQPTQNLFPSQRQQIPTLPGKIVESYEVFKSVDIPIDGNLYYFPKADRTELYTKRWLQNGTTEQLVYKLVKDEESGVENPIDKIFEKLESIEERLGKLDRNFRPNRNNNNKKED